MGYFKNTTVWGALWPPPNFVVSSSIMIEVPLKLIKWVKIAHHNK